MNLEPCTSSSLKLQSSIEHAFATICRLLHQREIVRKECPKAPEKRSRLWGHEDVTDILTNHEVRTSFREKIKVKQNFVYVHVLQCIREINACEPKPIICHESVISFISYQ
jgi:hypothetical protein